MVRTRFFHCCGPGSVPGWGTKILKLHGRAKKIKVHYLLIEISFQINLQWIRFIYFLNLFLAVLGLHFCLGVFCSCDE